MDAEEIQKLWRDPKFPGSYSGLANFQAVLKLDKGINISKEKLYEILSKDRNYILEMRKVKKKFKRRPMNTHGYGILWQADLGQMYTFNGYTTFLLCIDIFSRRIFCRLLKSKQASEVERAFMSIFSAAKIKPEKIETDQGSEFRNNRGFFEKEKIFLKFKVGANKARYVGEFS